MRDPVKERATLAAKHDFDSLPTDTDIEVRPAHGAELPILADMAHRLVPGVQMTVPVLTKPPAVMGRFSESRTGAWVPPVFTPPMAWGCSWVGV